ncbi:MAG TPA: sugar transferase [Deltaproteobacteria bacterium]|nr:sugar transferase [Deltaproteobacteria bacterium]
MTRFQSIQKRAFDLVFAGVGLLLLGWLILLAAVISHLDTGRNGFFLQDRVGKDGRLFKIIKIRSMRRMEGYYTDVTTDDDPRVTKIGRFWRKTKIDELPQLWNVFKGDMSFVGPRPDISGFADCLKGRDRLLLSVRPGITGPATLKFKDEEQILARQPDPEKYNREIIWPEKVRLNLEYIDRYTLWNDLKYIFKTIH